MSEKKKTGAQAASMVAISSILIPGNVPNRDTGWEKQLNELVESIKANGQVQPILVSALNTSQDGFEYELVAGQRRIEALKKIGHNTVKAVCIAAKATKKNKFGAHIAENFGRQDYTPMEQATLVKYAIEELGMTQQEVAATFGMTAGWVSQRVTALKQPKEVQKSLEEGDINFTHVREISRVKDDEEKKKLLKHAKKEDASTFKERVDEIVTGKKPRKKAKKAAETAAPTKSDNVRPKKDALAMMKKLDKAQAAAAKDEKKERVAHLSGILRGISWAYKLNGANIKV